MLLRINGFKLMKNSFKIIEPLMNLEHKNFHLLEHKLYFDIITVAVKQITWINI